VREKGVRAVGITRGIVGEPQREKQQFSSKKTLRAEIPETGKRKDRLVGRDRGGWK